MLFSVASLEIPLPEGGPLGAPTGVRIRRGVYTGVRVRMCRDHGGWMEANSGDLLITNVDANLSVGNVLCTIEFCRISFQSTFACAAKKIYYA